MKLNTIQQGPVTIIKLEGNLMGGPDATSLNTTLHELIEAGKKHVVIDLGGVKLMNSSGLSLLISSVTALKQAGGGLKLANASEKILSLLEITKLSPVFEHHKTVKSAVAKFKT
jgi:anti-sigma B factor antagonist